MSIVKLYKAPDRPPRSPFSSFFPFVRFRLKYSRPAVSLFRFYTPHAINASNTHHRFRYTTIRSHDVSHCAFPHGSHRPPLLQIGQSQRKEHHSGRAPPQEGRPEWQVRGLQVHRRDGSAASSSPQSFLPPISLPLPSSFPGASPICSYYCRRQGDQEKEGVADDALSHERPKPSCR